MYKLYSHGVRRLTDGACIPACEDNRDWQEYQKWLAEGNRPEPEFTPEELAEEKAREAKEREDRLIEEEIRRWNVEQAKKRLGLTQM